MSNDPESKKSSNLVKKFSVNIKASDKDLTVQIPHLNLVAQGPNWRTELLLKC